MCIVFRTLLYNTVILFLFLYGKDKYFENRSASELVNWLFSLNQLRVLDHIMMPGDSGEIIRTHCWNNSTTGTYIPFGPPSVIHAPSHAQRNSKVMTCAIISNSPSPQTPEATGAK